MKGMYDLVVIDDEAVIRESIVSLFPWHDLGFHISRTFDNGLKAMASICQTPPDAILSDIRMPMMTGLDLLKEINARKLRVPVVLLSAYADFSYAQEAIGCGAFDYIVKPVSVREMKDVFSRLSKRLDQGKRMTPALPADDIRSAFGQYIADSLADASLQEFAASCSISSEEAAERIEHEFGMPFRALVLEMRMEKATQMLGVFGMRVSEIAESLGYCNVGNFTRAFKQYHGIGPMEWRRRKNDGIHS